LPKASPFGAWNEGKARPVFVDRRPLHMCAECKERLGWIDPVALDPRVAQRIVLKPVEGHVNQVAKILFDGQGREYLLLEYRRQQGFDSGFPRSGLLIWHVGDIAAPVKNFVPFRLLDLKKAHGHESLDSSYRAPALIPFPND